jgi:DNA-binding transcriptional regulator YdaS (Cro superfamily)
MKKIGPQIAKWVENQQETAEIMGISPASLNQMLSGKIRLPLPRFLQIMYYRNPPQAEANDIFNQFLAKVDLPPNSIRVVMHPQENAASNNMPQPNNNDAIIDAVMASDIDDTAKVKVYSIIKGIGTK